MLSMNNEGIKKSNYMNKVKILGTGILFLIPILGRADSPNGDLQKEVEDYCLNTGSYNSSRLFNDLYKIVQDYEAGIDLEHNELYVFLKKNSIIEEQSKKSQPYNLSKFILQSSFIKGHFDGTYSQKCSADLSKAIFSACEAAIWNLDPNQPQLKNMPNYNALVNVWDENNKRWSSNIAAKIYKALCIVKLDLDFSAFQTPSNQMDDNARYAYNQNLGFCVWHCGLDQVLNRLALSKSNNQLINKAIHEQAKYAIIWEAIRSYSGMYLHSFDEGLMKKCNELYEIYSEKEPSVCPKEENPSSVLTKEQLKKLEEVFNFIKPDQNITKTCFGNMLFSKPPSEDKKLTVYQNVKVEDWNSKDIDIIDFGTFVPSGTTLRSCWAITSLLPLITRFIVVDPRVESGIMLSQVIKQEENQERNVWEMRDNKSPEQPFIFLENAFVDPLAPIENSSIGLDYITRNYFKYSLVFGTDQWNNMLIRASFYPIYHLSFRDEHWRIATTDRDRELFKNAGKIFQKRLNHPDIVRSIKVIVGRYHQHDETMQDSNNFSDILCKNKRYMVKYIIDFIVKCYESGNIKIGKRNENFKSAPDQIIPSPEEDRDDLINAYKRCLDYVEECSVTLDDYTQRIFCTDY